MINVVMGFIIDSEGRILIAKRNLKKNFGGLWEFPGGKIESKESPAHALIRELKEELSIEVVILKEYAPYLYRDGLLSIYFYPIQCNKTGGDIQNLEHEEIAFVKTCEFDSYRFSPPDYPAVNLVKNKYDEMLTRV